MYLWMHALTNGSSWETDMLHICFVRFKLTKESDWLPGLALLEEEGMSNILTLIDAKGYPVTASDGGSPSIWAYDLMAYRGAMSISMEK